jgi:hypothetical protein
MDPPLLHLEGRWGEGVIKKLSGRCPPVFARLDTFFLEKSRPRKSANWSHFLHMPEIQIKVGSNKCLYKPNKS